MMAWMKEEEPSGKDLDDVQQKWVPYGEPSQGVEKMNDTLAVCT